MAKETGPELEGKIKARYDKMCEDRRWYLQEGYDSAKLTIPSILPTDQDASNIVRTPENLVKPWQSIGAKGVRNLASKLGLTLFPPTGAFMRYQLSPEYKDELNKPDRQSQKIEIEKSLARREQMIMDDIEAQNVRTKMDQALRHLIVVGNVLVYLPPKGGVRVFPLNNYVTRRDFVGNVIELIYLEMMDKANLPENIRDALQQGGAEMKDGELMITDKSKKKANSVAVYTRLLLKGESYEVTQEADGMPVDLAGKSRIKKKNMPFLALRFVTIDGEHYGRGYVEEYRGDLKSAELLRKSIVIGAANAAKLIAMVTPGAAVTPRKLMEAENGAAILGRPDDVTMLQQNKHADMRTARETYMDLKQDLAAAFLLNSAYQRQAERVTAEEVRRMAEELEDALGGIYSVLAQELQLPIALRTEARLVKENKLGPIEDDAVKPVVVTGLAAIGRGHEFNRLREFMAFLATDVASINPEAGQYLIVSEVLERGGLGLGVPTEGLIKTQEQLAEEQQQAQQQATQQTLLEGAAPAIGDMASKELGGRVAAGQQGQQP